MGVKQSKPAVTLPYSAVIRDMRDKFGPECLECLHIWCSEFGFPDGGSLSVNQLLKVKEHLQNEWGEMLKAKKVSTKRVRMMKAHEKWLNVWMTEAEDRARKRTLERKQKAQAKRDANKSATVGENEPIAPLPYSADRQTAEQVAQAKPDVSESATVRESEPIAPQPQCANRNTVTQVAHIKPEVNKSVTVRDSGPIAPPTYCDDGKKTEEKMDQVIESVRQNGPIAAPRQHANRNTVEQKAQVKPDVREIETEWQSGSIVPYQAKANTSVSTRCIVVYHPWNINEVISAADKLPDPVEDSDEFEYEMQAFCKIFKPCGLVLRRILGHKLKFSDFEKISDAIPGDDIHPETIGVDRYRFAVNDLCEAIRKAFPRKCDWSEIHYCKQKPSERSYDFIERISGVYKMYSGLNPRTHAGPNTRYEYGLCNAIVEGLLPEVLASVKNTYIIDLRMINLIDLRCHAEHGYKLMMEKKRREEEKKEKALSSSFDRNRSFQQKQGRRGQTRGRGDGNCFSCGSPDHWVRDCPQKQRRRLL